MHITLSSNLVNSSYVFLVDVVLVLLVSRLIQMSMSSYNMKTIYEERKPLHLRFSRIPTLVKHGLTGRKILPTAVVSSTIILGLATAGSFSIDGVSRTATKTRTVPFLVGAASSELLVDFTKHVSRELDKASGIFVMLRSALRCAKRENFDMILFSSFGSISDPLSVKWPIQMFRLQNMSCLVEEEGFVERIIIRKQELWPIPDLSICNTTFSWDADEGMKPGVTNVSQSCPYEPIETWCFTHNSTFCIAAAKINQLFTVLLFEVHKNKSKSEELPGSGKYFVYSRLSRSKASTKVLKSIAFLSSTRAVSFPDAIEMASLTVYPNATVATHGERVNETEINLLLLGTTLGLSITLTLLLATVTCYFWLKYAVRAGRRKYNFFYSETDILSLAINEELNDEKCRFKRKEPFVLAIDDGQPVFTNSSGK